MKTILYILSGNEMGGATISFLNLILNLDRNEYVPIVVIPSKTEVTDLERILKENEIQCYRVFLVASVLRQFQYKIIIRWILKYLYLAIEKRKSRIELNKLVHKVLPDVIHTNVGNIHEGFHVAQMNNIPHVWHLREYQTKDFHWYIYPSYKRFCSYLRKSFVISITEDIKKYFGLQKQNNAFTIYNGIFKEDECSSIISKDNYFLMASRISKEKGHSDVIKAFSQFSKYREYRLKIIGFGDEKYIGELKKLSIYYNCQDRVDFLGFQEDVKPLMTKAKALIVASYNEGFGRMTAEAAFCGTIVIGKNTGGTKEILERTGGLLFDTIGEMTGQMEFVSNMDANDYFLMAQNAQKRAVKSYSVENNVRCISDLYKLITQNT